jgi:hypothetical protein
MWVGNGLKGGGERRISERVEIEGVEWIWF